MCEYKLATSTNIFRSLTVAKENTSNLLPLPRSPGQPSTSAAWETGHRSPSHPGSRAGPEHYEPRSGEATY